MTRRVPLILESLERRLLLTSNGWDGPGRGNTTLDYTIGTIPAHLNLDENTFHTTIRAAFDVWEEVVEVDFHQVFPEPDDPKLPRSIDIIFDNIPNPLYIALAKAPPDFPGVTEPSAGDIRFDSSNRNWEFGNAAGESAFDVMLIAVHEIGNALGISDINGGDAVMSRGATADEVFTQLTELDIAAAQSLYAPRGDDSASLSFINQLFEEIRSGNDNGAFDLNSDNLVNASDRDVLIHDILRTTYGDANLDREFNTADLVAVFQAGLYEQNEDATWETGDWSGDLRFNSSDLTLAFQDGGFMG